MKSIIGRFMRFWSEERSLTVFLILLIIEILLIAPISHVGLAVGIVNNILFPLLLVAGLLTMTHHKALQAMTMIVVALTVATYWARHVFRMQGLELLEGVLMLSCTIGFLVIVLWQVYRVGPVTGHRIMGAVAAYLLLSLIFAIAYSLVDALNPCSFQLSTDHPEGNNRTLFYYFSVITLTTTGYGDIIAVNPVARTLVMMEAFIGQLYPAILIARLVTLHVEVKREKRHE
jgi:voltage-gated potassium channel Kch